MNSKVSSEDPPPYGPQRKTVDQHLYGTIQVEKGDTALIYKIETASGLLILNSPLALMPGQEMVIQFDGDHIRIIGRKTPAEN